MKRFFEWWSDLEELGAAIGAVAFVIVFPIVGIIVVPPVRWFLLWWLSIWGW